MNILMIPSWYPSEESPMNGSFFREQIQMLRRAGHRVTVLSPRPVFIAFWRGYKFSQKVEDGVTVLRFNFPSWPIGLRCLEKFHYALLCRRLRAWIEEHKLDAEVIHAHSIYPALLLADPLSRALNLPLVLTEHRPSSLERPVSGFRGRALWRAVKHCRVRTAVSPLFSKALEQHWCTTAWDVVRLPVRDDFFSANHVLPEHFTFLHISHLDEIKHVDLLLAAFSRLKNNRPEIDMRLRIVGGNKNQVEKYRKQANALRVADWVELTGSKDREGVIAEMAAASCFVLPSEIESAGAVFAEAQACGVPCIATKTWGGQFMVDENTGVLCEINDLSGLTEALDAMLHAEFDHDKIREIAFSRYSEQAFVSRSLDLYRSAQHQSIS